MNKEEIIRMAREAGCHASVITGAICFNPDVLERFAALVAANEREACAKIADEYRSIEGNAIAEQIRGRK